MTDFRTTDFKVIRTPFGPKVYWSETNVLLFGALDEDVLAQLEQILHWYEEEQA